MTKTLFVDAHTFDECHQGIRTFMKGIYETIDVTPSELQIFLAANDVENLKTEFSNQPNFKFIELKSRNKYIRLGYEIPKIIKKNKFDFAHFNYYLPLFLNKKCNYIVTIHDVLFIDFPQYFPLKYKLINTFLFKRSAVKANIVTTVSNYSARRIKENFNIADKKIEVLPNAVNSKYIDNHDKLDDKNYLKKKYGLDSFIVYVSRIEPRKNHEKLIQAYQELKLWEQGISLVLIGKESFKDEELFKLIDEVSQLSKGKLLKLNDIPNVDLIKFYNAATLAVFPSLCEGFGIPPIESAVLKTSTICSHSTAMKDFFFFEDRFFDANSKEAIKTKIEEYLSKNHQENELIKIANCIKKTYNWSITAQKLKSLILDDKG
ncbi:glycosyltransferase family 4 protein [Psychroserpens sp. S379A]|uniref:glycosyltransferase family 4 protein n=1 Tax=Psychroserpens sp. S379A TaxID=3415137 RepID=UPI003C79E00A